MVAGGFAVASLALQLMERAEKLSDLLHCISNLPAEIKDLLAYLNILSSLLQQVDQLTRSTHIDPAILEPAREAVQLCEGLASLLRNKISPSAAQLDRYKKMNSRYRFTLSSLRGSRRKAEVDELSGRMHRSLTLLLLANQALSTWVFFDCRSCSG